MNRYIYLFIALISILTTGCEKIEFHYDPKLPPATQEGKGTMGFMFNSKLWETLHAGAAFAQVQYSNNEADAMQITGVGEVGKTEANINIDITDYSTLQTGRIYKLASSGTATSAIYVYKGDDSSCEYEEDDIEDGELTVTYFDKEKKIIAGTFWATYAMEGCETVRVTDGRFDLKF